MECDQCKFCNRPVTFEGSRPGSVGRVCDSCRWKTLPRCGIGTCKTPVRKQKRLRTLPNKFFSLGEVGKCNVRTNFKIKQENVLCCTSCYAKVHSMAGSIANAKCLSPPPASAVNNLVDNTKPIIGRPRVPYTEASTRTKYDIKKKARHIYEESNSSMKKQLDELTLGCSEDVLVDISSPSKNSPSKVG